MSDDKGVNVNFNIGEGSQVNAPISGDVNSPSNTYSVGETDQIAKFFESLKVELEKDEAEARSVWEAPVTELKALAAETPSEPTPPAAMAESADGGTAEPMSLFSGIEERCVSLIESIKPYAGTIARAVAIFGTEVLKSMASKNPIISGIVAVAEEFSEDD